MFNFKLCQGDDSSDEPMFEHLNAIHSLGSCNGHVCTDRGRSGSGSGSGGKSGPVPGTGLGTGSAFGSGVGTGSD